VLESHPFHRRPIGLLLVCGLLGACEPPPAPATPAAPAPAAAPSTAARAPVFTDRKKQATYERAAGRLESIRAALLSPNLDEAKTTELGFECASLRADKDALATETDPAVRRLIGDVTRMCGMDVPLATAYVELHAIEIKRLSNGNVKNECFGLKVAM